MLYRATYRLILAVLTLAMLASCGYSVRKGAAISELRLGDIGNSSLEPGLQDRFIVALERELSRRGIRVDRSASIILEGRLTQVSVKGTAEASGVYVSYEVTVSGTFSLLEPDGKRTPLRGRNYFMSTFGGSGTLEGLASSREKAVAKALEYLAIGIASEVAEGIAH